MKKWVLILFVGSVVSLTSCTKEGFEPMGDETGYCDSDKTSESKSSFGKARATRAYNEWFSTQSSMIGTQTGVYSPGSGTGNATHFGNAMTCFNQQVVFYNNMPVGSLPAPVNQYYATTLAAAGITNVPNTVNAVTYDSQGNSVWFSTNGGTTLTPVSATRVNMLTSLTIVGGTGKFSGATGTATMNGYFNPQSPTLSAQINATGSITY